MTLSWDWDYPIEDWDRGLRDRCAKAEAEIEQLRATIAGYVTRTDAMAGEIRRLRAALGGTP